MRCAYERQLLSAGIALTGSQLVIFVSLKVVMNLSDLPNLLVPLGLLSLIVLAAVYFSRIR